MREKKFHRLTLNENSLRGADILQLIRRQPRESEWPFYSYRSESTGFAVAAFIVW
jgi:hypothetical protein